MSSMQRKPIILQTPVRYYPHIGGVEYVVKNLSESLVKNGYAVKVICSGEYPKVFKETLHGVQITKLPYTFKITNTNITFDLISKLLKEDYDIVHTHMPTPWSADLSVLIGKVRGKKTVITIHNDLKKSGFFPSLITSLYLYTLYVITLYLSDVITVVNPDWENSFSATKNLLKLFKNKIVEIPNGVDATIFSPKKIKKTSNSIVFVSVLDRYHDFKGLELLFKSLQVVQNSIKNVVLFIIGDGEKRKYFEVLSVKLKISKNVRFIGATDQKTLAQYYNKSYVSVQPSLSTEGFSLATVEALFCNIPVIITNLIGVAKKVKENNAGIIVQQNDSTSLSNAIIFLLQNSLKRKKFGDNGYKFVKNKYSWSKIVEDYIQVYQSR